MSGELTEDTQRGFSDEGQPVEGGEAFEGETFLESIWRVLTSMRLALILLGIVALFAGVGTIIPQGKEASEYPAIFAKHMSVDNAHRMTTVVLKLGLNNLYHTPWFLSLLYLMSVNLIMCNARRVQILWRRTYRPRVQASELGVRAMSHTRAWQSKVAAAQAKALVAATLRGERYRVLEAAGNPATLLYADRGRLGNWGSYAMHLAILMIFFGAAWGHHPKYGFDKGFGLAVGQSAKIPQDILPANEPRFDTHRTTEYTLTLNKFTIPTLPDGTPRQYVSNVTIEGNGQKQDIELKVNHPFKYHGLTLYQVSWGMDGFVVEATVKDADGTEHQEFLAYPLGENGEFHFSTEQLGQFIQQIQHNGWVVIAREFVPDAEVEGDMLVGKSRFPNHPWVQLLAVRDPSKITGGNMMEMLEPVGWVSETETAEFHGVTFRLAGVNVFSGFSVRKDPGVWAVWLGALIGFCGIIMTFYIPHRVIRVRVMQIGDTTDVLAGATCRLPSQFEKEFTALGQALE